MLSNNFHRGLTILLLLFGLVSCSDKQEKIPVLDFENKAQVLDAVKKHYNKETQAAFGGLFDETGKQFVAAGWEINNADDWGIKFAFLEKSEDEFESIYETECDLVYYNSQGYFMGSGGGEVFSYIIDLENKQVYYAHLVVESQTATYLFISDNTKNKELINFFTLTFKKDYPGLTIVEDDIVLD